MNLLLLEPDEMNSAGEAIVTGDRATHVRTVLGKGVGDEVRVGVVGGQLGQGTIAAADGVRVVLHCELDSDPPAPAAVRVVLALPRPPVLRRVLQHLAAAGIKRIALVRTARVERSYFQSPAVRPGAIATQVRLGLSQGVDTMVPSVDVFDRFIPFVEDVMPQWIAGTRGLVADPAASQPCPADPEDPVTVFVGPEGGFVPFELERLSQAGLQPVHLGRRPLRVETAVAALLGRLALR